VAKGDGEPSFFFGGQRKPLRELS